MNYLRLVQPGITGSTGVTEGHIGQLTARALSFNFITYPDSNPFRHEEKNQYYDSGED